MYVLKLLFVCVRIILNNVEQLICGGLSSCDRTYSPILSRVFKRSGGQGKQQATRTLQQDAGSFVLIRILISISFTESQIIIIIVLPSLLSLPSLPQRIGNRSPCHEQDQVRVQVGIKTVATLPYVI